MERQQLQLCNNQEVKHQIHLSTTAAQPQPYAALSSPSRSQDEFSFSISVPDVAKAPQINPNLSPADDIFFDGHLLPLIGIRPESTFPALQEWQQQNNVDEAGFKDDQNPTRCPSSCREGKGRSGKLKPFSLFAGKDRYDGVVENRRSKKLKSIFNMVKKYMRLIKLKPGILSTRTRRGRNSDRHRESYSSAPVTMGPSPAYSGVLVDSGTVTPTAVKSTDSTMEELQAAIQAAIAHCKNSINDDSIQIQLT